MTIFSFSFAACAQEQQTTELLRLCDHHLKVSACMFFVFLFLQTMRKTETIERQTIQTDDEILRLRYADQMKVPLCVADSSSSFQQLCKTVVPFFSTGKTATGKSYHRRKN